MAADRETDNSHLRPSARSAVRDSFPVWIVASGSQECIAAFRVCQRGPGASWTAPSRVRAGRAAMPRSRGRPVAGTPRTRWVPRQSRATSHEGCGLRAEPAGREVGQQSYPTRGWEAIVRRTWWCQGALAPGCELGPYSPKSWRLRRRLRCGEEAAAPQQTPANTSSSTSATLSWRSTQSSTPHESSRRVLCRETVSARLDSHEHDRSRRVPTNHSIRCSSKFKIAEVLGQVRGEVHDIANSFAMHTQ